MTERNRTTFKQDQCAKRSRERQEVADPKQHMDDKMVKTRVKEGTHEEDGHEDVLR